MNMLSILRTLVMLSILGTLSSYSRYSYITPPLLEYLDWITE